MTVSYITFIKKYVTFYFKNSWLILFYQKICTIFEEIHYKYHY